MFIRSDLGQPKKTTAPAQNRVMGAVVLLIAIVLLMAVALTADASIFQPLSASDAATQTSQAQNPFVLPPGHPPIPNSQPDPNNNLSPV